MIILRKLRVIVNTTTLGMNGVGDPGIDFSRARKDAVVADLVYVPLETPLLRLARESMDWSGSTVSACCSIRQFPDLKNGSVFGLRSRPSSTTLLQRIFARRDACRGIDRVDRHGQVDRGGAISRAWDQRFRC